MSYTPKQVGSNFGCMMNLLYNKNNRNWRKIYITYGRMKFHFGIWRTSNNIYVILLTQLVTANKAKQYSVIVPIIGIAVRSSKQRTSGWHGQSTPQHTNYHLNIFQYSDRKWNPTPHQSLYVCDLIRIAIVNTLTDPLLQWYAFISNSF